jgi:hypothetical protein
VAPFEGFQYFQLWHHASHDLDGHAQKNSNMHTADRNKLGRLWKLEAARIKKQCVLLTPFSQHRPSSSLASLLDLLHTFHGGISLIVMAILRIQMREIA